MNKTIFTKSHRYLVKQLTAARKQAKLKQKDVARRLDRTQSYVSKIEAGQRRIDIVQLKELAGIYKKKIDFFIK
ncbi:MAG: helix-turn-helix transcriptional regulator [Candidatus Omnitrophota bacterium]|nr:helix-turn-helix transcriptional regulator [Candidatus Omnitrophota bacterium]